MKGMVVRHVLLISQKDEGVSGDLEAFLLSGFGVLGKWSFLCGETRAGRNRFVAQRGPTHDRENPIIGSSRPSFMP